MLDRIKFAIWQDEVYFAVESPTKTLSVSENVGCSSQDFETLCPASLIFKKKKDERPEDEDVEIEGWRNEERKPFYIIVRPLEKQVDVSRLWKGSAFPVPLDHTGQEAP